MPGLMSAEPISGLNAALAGRYQVERQLGEGGMATVYLAKDLKHNRHVVANYDVSPSDDRFVMVQDAESEDAAVDEPLQIHVVLNWFAELRARVPN